MKSHVFALESNSTEYELLINGNSIGADTGDYNSGAGTSWTIGNRAYEVQTSPDLVNWTSVNPQPVPGASSLRHPDLGGKGMGPFE